MRVLTLIPDKFTQACAELAHKVCVDFKPDVVVGVYHGGAVVAQEMMPHIAGARYVEVRMSRASSTAKNSKGGSSVLRHLPYFITNILRKVESWMTERRLRNGKVASRTGDATLPSDINPKSKILIVDDAIDTGSTMLRVAESIREQLPTCDLRTAAITVTQPRALLLPDYALYTNRTLIRFPWSSDFKH